MLTREVIERQTPAVTNRSQSDFWLFSEGYVLIVTYCFWLIKKQRKDLNIKHFTTNITR